jgi:putative DNA-invertase from lambdoid prophage Rac
MEQYMSRIAYYRVSTTDQSIDAQRGALGGGFDREFSDEGISGGTLAAQRPGFAALLSYIREGDSLSVYAIDRLGRDAIDVQKTVRDLMVKGVSIDVRGLGTIAKGAGEIIVAVLAQVAEMERERIRERCEAGRNAAKAALLATGRTHRGKVSMGRPKAADPASVVTWRRENSASIATTAAQFGLSEATVKRYWGAAA